MSDDDAEALVAPLVASLLGALDRLEAFARAMHPPRLVSLVAALGTADEALKAALIRVRAIDGDIPLRPVLGGLGESADFALEAFADLRAAAADGEPMAAFRALGRHSRAIEALYPLAGTLPAVSRWFLDPASRDDPMLIERLRAHRPGTGVTHIDNDRAGRGGFSMYVPEYLDPATAVPLVVALHGGSGHGRQLLWNWVREARTTGFIVVAPTSTGRTWALNDPDIDLALLESILDRVGGEWSIDQSRILLTGISDGGTFTYVDGLLETSRFTHLAPIAAAFHPMLVAVSDPARTAGLPIYLVHGALDWMFPVALARTANVVLTEAGARVTYREIRDLSHTYPTEENSRIAEWLRTG